jgi:hypothetical protein
LASLRCRSESEFIVLVIIILQVSEYCLALHDGDYWAGLRVIQEDWDSPYITWIRAYRIFMKICVSKLGRICEMLPFGFRLRNQLFFCSSVSRSIRCVAHEVP